jgi:hypothetical protein
MSNGIKTDRADCPHPIDEGVLADHWMGALTGPEEELSNCTCSSATDAGTACRTSLRSRKGFVGWRERLGCKWW